MQQLAHASAQARSVTLTAQLTSQLSTETHVAANAMFIQISAADLHLTLTRPLANASVTLHRILAQHHSLSLIALHAHVTVQQLLLMLE